VDDYVAEWDARPHGTRGHEEEVRDFFKRLLVPLSADRELLLAVLAAGHFNADLAPAALKLEQAFVRVLDRVERMLDEELDVRGLHSENRPALARIMIGLMISFALTPNWLRIGTGAGETSTDEVIAEAARVIVHGLIAR
jgi:AcrR family transcriptional regulator